MDTLIHADIFFFITTIAVVCFTFLGVLILSYFLIILKRFDTLSKKLEKNVAGVGEDVQEMVEHIKESFLFNLLFPHKKKKKRELK